VVGDVTGSEPFRVRVGFCYPSTSLPQVIFHPSGRSQFLDDFFAERDCTVPCCPAAGPPAMNSTAGIRHRAMVHRTIDVPLRQPESSIVEEQPHSISGRGSDSTMMGGPTLMPGKLPLADQE
jgi:hypothetical protein